MSEKPLQWKEEKIPSRDGYELSVRIYEAENPKAVVKIIHGMEEHQARYRAFAEFLRGAGYTVVTADMRGHGPDAPVLSHIADRDGHLRLLEDEEVLLDMIRRRWPGLPVILMGHSMGTIIARAFLQKHSEGLRKVVLSGYPNPNGAAAAGAVIAKMVSAVATPKGHSKLLDQMVLGPFSKAVPGAKTPQDWLSVNPDNVRAYREDPLCGAPFTAASYEALFQLIRMMDSPGDYVNVRRELPLLLISGKEDPCTGGEKGRADSEKRLREAGFENLETVLLDGMRHEILNEQEAPEVFREILEYLDREE